MQFIKQFTATFIQVIIYRFAFVILAALVMGAMAHADCLKMCDPAISKPCGKSCINKAFTCHKPVTLTCIGKPVEVKK